MPRKPSRLRDLADDALGTLDFMMTSQRTSTRVLKYAFFACAAWLALSVAAMLSRCSA